VTSWADQLSRQTILTCAALFGVGLIVGLLQYLNRSQVVEQQLAGSNAIPIHVALALIAVAIVVAVSRWRQGKGDPYPLWAAPFSRSARGRLVRTVSMRSGASPKNIARAIAAAFLCVVLLYNFVRAGQQVFGGLDPNFTVNAWGGPSYLGAMLAHSSTGSTSSTSRPSC
jgi:hypothetical protein